MYCLPLDDVCQWENFQQKVVVEAAEANLINQQTFSLGTFNGRSFIFLTTPGTKPMIVIIEDDKSDSYNATFADYLR